MVFPRDFRWGAAISWDQIEGSTREDGTTPSIWDVSATESDRRYRRQTGETLHSVGFPVTQREE